MKCLRLFIPCLLLLFTIPACRENELDVDTSDISIPELEVLRFEEEFFAINERNIEEKTDAMKKRYGIWYEHYLMGFLSPGGTSDSSYTRNVLSFVSDPDVREAYRYVKNIFTKAEMERIVNETGEALKRFRYHFPAKPLPKRLITCTTGWNYAVAYADSNLVAGLDMYLGDTAKFYAMLRYPQYQVRKMNRHYVVPDLMRGMLLTEFDKSPAGNTLLQHTIFYGKLYYALNALLPGAADSLLIGYTGRQEKYCRAYEKQLWSFFAEKNRLYENNLHTVRELTREGPFTGAISKECPPRIAMWVGWQIVRSYMKNNEQVTLAQLMSDQDAQKILNKSRYRP